MTADVGSDQLADRSVIDALFDRAAAAADTSAERVTYRLRRADHLRRSHDPAGELALYQQILLDPKLRGVTISESDQGASPASGFVYQAIANLLRRSGEALYQPYGHAAAEKLATARQNSDVPARRDQLISLAETYPNSKPAGEAILLAAGDDESLGDARSAASLLRKFASRYPGSDQRALVFESLARLYLAMTSRTDRVSIAIGRLEQGAKLPDSPRLRQPLPMPDGTTLQNVTFAEAAATLRKFQAGVETSELPDPHFPAYVKPVFPAKLPVLMPEDPAAAIPDVTGLVKSIDNWSRNDRIVTFAENRGLCVFAIGSAQPLFTTAAVTAMPHRIAWMGGNLLVWCPTRLLLIRGENSTAATAAGAASAGTVLWDSSLATFPAAQLASVNNDADGGTTTATGGNEPSDVVNLPPDLLAQRVARANMLMRGIRLNGNAQIRINGRLINNIGVPAPVVPATEQIDHLVPGSDRIVFSTSGQSPDSSASENNAGDNGGMNGGINGGMNGATTFPTPPAAAVA